MHYIPACFQAHEVVRSLEFGVGNKRYVTPGPASKYVGGVILLMGLIIFYKGGMEVFVVVEVHPDQYGVINQNIRHPTFLWKVIQTHHCVINQIHDHADSCFSEIDHAPSHA